MWMHSIPMSNSECFLSATKPSLEHSSTVSVYEIHFSSWSQDPETSVPSRCLALPPLSSLEMVFIAPTDQASLRYKQCFCKKVQTLGFPGIWAFGYLCGRICSAEVWRLAHCVWYHFQAGMLVYRRESSSHGHHFLISDCRYDVARYFQTGDMM